jgi:hypothetical protein
MRPPLRDWSGAGAQGRLRVELVAFYGSSWRAGVRGPGLKSLRENCSFARWGLLISAAFPRLAPWAAFLRRFAAKSGALLYYAAESLVLTHILKAVLILEALRGGEAPLFHGAALFHGADSPLFHVHAQGRISGKAPEVANNFNYPCATSMARSGVARGNPRRLLLQHPSPPEAT